MKNLKTILFSIGLIIFIISCEKDNLQDKNFYNQEYRFGIWVNHDVKDTLEFTSFSTVIRKGLLYNEVYSYWIDDETIFFSVGGWETSHSIREAKGDKVVIENMYISIGYTDNSGTFFKLGN